MLVNKFTDRVEQSGKHSPRKLDKDIIYPTKDKPELTMPLASQ